MRKEENFLLNRLKLLFSTPKRAFLSAFALIILLFGTGIFIGAKAFAKEPHPPQNTAALNSDSRESQKVFFKFSLGKNYICNGKSPMACRNGFCLIHPDIRAGIAGIFSGMREVMPSLTLNLTTDKCEKL